MSRRLIESQHIDIIRDNIGLAPVDIKKLLQEAGIIVSEASINNYIRLLKEREQEEGELALAIIENGVADFVKQRTESYLTYLDNNIKEINNMLTSKELYKKNGEFNHELFIKMSKALGEQIKNMLLISPGDAGGKSTVSLQVNADFEDIMRCYQASKATDGKEAGPGSKEAEFTLIEG